MIVNVNNSIICDNDIYKPTELENNQEYVIKHLALKKDEKLGIENVFFDYSIIKPNKSVIKTKDYFILDIMNRKFILPKNTKLLYKNGDSIMWGDITACMNNRFYIIVNNNIITTSTASNLTLGKIEKEFIKLSDDEIQYILIQEANDLIQIVVKN